METENRARISRHWRGVRHVRNCCRMPRQNKRWLTGAGPQGAVAPQGTHRLSEGQGRAWCRWQPHRMAGQVAHARRPPSAGVSVRYRNLEAWANVLSIAPFHPRIYIYRGRKTGREHCATGGGVRHVRNWCHMPRLWGRRTPGLLSPLTKQKVGSHGSSGGSATLRGTPGHDRLSEGQGRAGQPYYILAVAANTTTFAIAGC